MANNTVNVSTGYSLLYLNQGSHPLVLNTLLAKGEPKVSNKAAKEALERMKMALVDAKSNLTIVQQQMKRAVDKKRRTKEHKIGDEVVLSTVNLRTYCPNLPPKIKARWVGPFCSQKIVSLVVFGLDFPLGWRIHPVFYTSKLKCYIHSEELLTEAEPPPPVLVGDTLEYEVEGILRHQGTGARHRYLVLWKGYSLTEAT